MKVLTIRLPYGRAYTVYPNGDIAHLGTTPSGNWKMLGLSPARGWSFGKLAIPLARVFADEELRSNLLFKNGNPRYTVVDVDHGTQRCWGNTMYHGVRSITVSEVPTLEEVAVKMAASLRRAAAAANCSLRDVTTQNFGVVLDTVFHDGGETRCEKFTDLGHEYSLQFGDIDSRTFDVRQGEAIEAAFGVLDRFYAILDSTPFNLSSPVGVIADWLEECSRESDARLVRELWAEPNEKQPVWRLLANLGDYNPIDHGGYFVFTDETGQYDPEVEYLDAPAEDDGEWVVYRFEPERCAWVNGVLSDNKYHRDHPAWFFKTKKEKAERPQDSDTFGDAARSADMSRKELRTLLCSEDPCQRAVGYEVIAGYCGWHEFDHYPVTLTREEAEARYAAYDPKKHHGLRPRKQAPSAYHEPIPDDFPVRPLGPGDKAKDKVTCGYCGLSWDDAIPTSWTPTPAARCPFEYFHK
jgi:hypothetical protein